MSISAIGGNLGFALQVSSQGLTDAILRMNVAANNIANANTNGFVPAQVASSNTLGGGVSTSVVQPSLPNNTVDNTLPSQTSLVEEMVNLIVAKAAYQANAKVIGVEKDSLDSLLKEI